MLSFAWLATVLAEAGRADEAIRVCEAAAAWRLEDGTNGGYAGRAARIVRRQIGPLSLRPRTGLCSSPRATIRLPPPRERLWDYLRLRGWLS